MALQYEINHTSFAVFYLSIGSIIGVLFLSVWNSSKMFTAMLYKIGSPIQPESHIMDTQTQFSLLLPNYAEKNAKNSWGYSELLSDIAYTHHTKINVFY
jgi:hypothetical protein